MKISKNYIADNMTGYTGIRICTEFLVGALTFLYGTLAVQ